MPLSAAAPLAGDTAALAKTGLGWWRDTLTGMLPTRRGDGGSDVAEVDIELGEHVAIVRIADGVGQRYVEDCSLTGLDADGWAQLGSFIDNARVHVVLEPPHVYRTSLVLPQALRGRAREAIALRLAELSPVDPDQLLWAFKTTPIGDGKLEAEIVFAKRAALEDIDAAFEAQGLLVPTVVTRGASGSITLQRGHDFRRRKRLGDIRPFAIAAAIVAAIPLVTLLAAEFLIWRAEAGLDAARERAAPGIAAEQALRNAVTTSRQLAELAAMRPATSQLADLAARLPANAAVIRVAGDASGMTDLDVSAPNLDELNPAFARDEDFKLEPTGQSASSDGGYAVSYRRSAAS